MVAPGGTMHLRKSPDEIEVLKVMLEDTGRFMTVSEIRSINGLEPIRASNAIIQLRNNGFVEASRELCPNTRKYVKVYRIPPGVATRIRKEVGGAGE